MKNELNELVQRLTVKQEIECFRPNKNAESLKKCIERDYVHVHFKRTGTELGVTLAKNFCNLEEADFENSTGRILLVGALTLNYNKVKCFAEIDLSSCEGVGWLEAVNDVEYKAIITF